MIPHDDRDVKGQLIIEKALYAELNHQIAIFAVSRNNGKIRSGNNQAAYPPLAQRYRAPRELF